MNAAESVGVAERAMEMAVAYAKERRQFDRPIGSYQAVSHACAQMLLEVEGARAAVYWAAWALDFEPETAPLAVACAKAYAGDAGRRVPRASLQVHGGIGFTWEHDLHFFLKRGEANAHAYGEGSRAPRAHRHSRRTLNLSPRTRVCAPEEPIQPRGRFRDEEETAACWSRGGAGAARGRRRSGRDRRSSRHPRDPDRLRGDAVDDLDDRVGRFQGAHRPVRTTRSTTGSRTATSRAPSRRPTSTSVHGPRAAASACGCAGTTRRSPTRRPGVQPCPAAPATITGTIGPEDVVGPTGQGIEVGAFDELTRRDSRRRHVRERPHRRPAERRDPRPAGRRRRGH